MAKTSRPRIVVLAMPFTAASTVAAPLDVLGAVGLLTHRCLGRPPEPAFDLSVATIDGDPVACHGGLRLMPERAMADAGGADLVVISAVVSFRGMGEVLPRAVEWLATQHARGTQLASVCTGAFPLAQTGLLDGRTATTHWAAADDFRARYPAVRLQPWRMFTDEGTLYCSAGSNAGFDLALHLVAKLLGREAALECARAMVVDLGRGSQSPYEAPELPRGHRDEAVLVAQRHVEDHPDRPHTIPALARRAGLSQRTFERRFKSATGLTPLRYLQRVRVEAAKRMLETGTEPFDQITYQVGYEDPSTFRALFRRLAGVSPRAYRARFGPAPSAPHPQHS